MRQVPSRSALKSVRTTVSKYKDGVPKRLCISVVELFVDCLLYVFVCACVCLHNLVESVYIVILHATVFFFPF